MALEPATSAAILAAPQESAATAARFMSPAAWLAAARSQAEAGRLGEARDTLVACLTSHPGHAAGFLELGRVLASAGYALDAISCFQQSVALAPADIAARLELAAAATRVAQHATAVEAYLGVLARVPEHHSALNNLGLSLVALGRDAEAEQAFRTALELMPTLGEAHGNLGALLQRQGRMAGALACYRQAVEAKPDWAEAWNNLAVVACILHDPANAERALREAIRLKPGHVEALYNLGNLLHRRGDEPAATASYRAALAVDPDHAEALYNLSTLTADPTLAHDLCQRSLAAKPEFSEALVGLASAKLKACDWTDLDGLIERIIGLVRDRSDAAVAPFSFLQLCGDPSLQQRCARNWVRNRIEPALEMQPASARPRQLRAGEKLKIGYLCADFRNHAVGNLLVEVFERHERRDFEVFGYSCGPDDGSSARRRIAAALDRFVELRNVPSGEISRRIRTDGVDVLVDLTGHTEHGRTDVLASRPAPVQVSYLGFPGTLGAGFVDYMLADRFLVPGPFARYYDETVVYLPSCYQVTGAGVDGPSRPRARRAELGLPDDGFVFCCFNNPYKIRHEVFEAWMRILTRVRGSVLWLAEFNAAARRNLQQEAARRGVDPDRLVFAPIAAPDEHAWRLAGADLFLDTTPYSAGATASQTLQAGVPLLTLTGECYVSRMAGSLLSALGLQQLIASDLRDYEERAVALAGDPSAVEHLKGSLRAVVARSALFDAGAGARALEAAYRAMWEQAGVAVSTGRAALEVGGGQVQP